MIEQVISSVQRPASKERWAAHTLAALCVRPPASALPWLVALSCSSGVVAQQQPPSEDELRSMYCVEVIRAEIGLQRHLISASDAAASSATTPVLRQQWIDTSAELLQGLAELEVVRYRLQTYMLPRIHALDAFSLAEAMRRGDADFLESRAVGACAKPTWLPP